MSIDEDIKVMFGGDINKMKLCKDCTWHSEQIDRVNEYSDFVTRGFQRLGLVPRATTVTRHRCMIPIQHRVVDVVNGQHKMRPEKPLDVDCEIVRIQGRCGIDAKYFTPLLWKGNTTILQERKEEEQADERDKDKQAL